MADFVVDKRLLLLNLTAPEDGSGASWGTVIDQTDDDMVRDESDNGTLSTDDWIDIFGIKYTGYYVEVDGQNYGIFKSSTIGIIPYDSASVGGTLELAGDGSTSLFDETLDNAANCFLTGTRIATPDGARPIETLRPGDRVLTAEGAATPVLWVWRQEITNIFGLGEARAPIRVAAHALAPGCPARDLIVTADHALLIDGFLINAGALVNGTTITAEPLARMPARFSYWHVETGEHTVLLAENCPAESFIDYTPRESFDNYAAYLDRFGEARIIEEMPIPRISTHRLLLPELRRRLGIGRAA